MPLKPVPCAADRYTDYLYRLYADIFRQIQCRRICFFTFPVISTALLLSWVISATVAPVLGHAWIKPKQLINENDVYNTAFYKKFRSVLSWSMLHQKIVILSTVSIFIGSLLLVPLIKQEFFPASVRPELLVELNLPEGSSIKATDEAALKLTNMLKDNPDVESIGSYVGKSAPRFVLVMDPVQPRNNYAQLVVVAKVLMPVNV